MLIALFVVASVLLAWLIIWLAVTTDKQSKELAMEQNRRILAEGAIVEAAKMSEKDALAKINTEAKRILKKR